VSYERSVSADPHRLSPETVWEVRMPAIRVGADAADDARLGYQLGQLGLSGDGRGLIVTDSDLVSLGHVDRVADELEADGFDVDVYDGDGVEREPSIEAVEECIAFVRDEMGEDGYDFYLGLGGGSCMDTAKATRAIVANGGEVLDYVAAPTGAGKNLTESGPPLILLPLPTTAGTGSEISPVAILSVPEKGIKRGSPARVRADAAVLDPTLTTTLPPDLTAKTAMDALGHAIEGYHPPPVRRPASPRKSRRPSGVRRTNRLHRDVQREGDRPPFVERTTRRQQRRRRHRGAARAFEGRTVRCDRRTHRGREPRARDGVSRRKQLSHVPRGPSRRSRQRAPSATTSPATRRGSRRWRRCSAPTPPG